MIHSTAPSPVIPPREGGAWAIAAVLSLVIGIAASTYALGPPGSAYLLVVLCIIGWLLALTVPTERGGWRGVLKWGVEFGVAATAAIGLLTAFGLVGLVWILALAVGNRRVRRFIRRQLPSSSRPSPSSPPPDDLISNASSAFSSTPTAVRDLSQVSVEGLCFAWRHTYVVLDRARSAPCILALVEQRRLILEEIDRRDPQGLGRWLASNPRAAGNPLPYLTPTDASDRVDQDGTAD